MKFGTYSLIILILFFITKCKYPTRKCEFKQIKTLYTIQTAEGTDSGYAHVILIKTFYKNCIDSASLIKIVKDYIDTISSDKPINAIQLYSSDRYFREGPSQDMDEIDKDCLVKISIRENKSMNFAFYNNAGKMIYMGPRWRPCYDCDSTVYDFD